MSKYLHDNERYIKELADNYEPVPPTLIWDEIEHVLDDDNDERRSFLFLWLLGIVLIGAMMFINIRGNKDKKSPIVKQESFINDSQKQSDPKPSIIKAADSKTIIELKQRRNTNIAKTISQVADNKKGKKVDSENVKSLVTQQQQQQQQSNIIDKSTVQRPLKANTYYSDGTAIIIKEDIFKHRMSTPSTESTFENKNVILVTALQKLKWIPRPLETGIQLPAPSGNLTAIVCFDFKNTTPWFVELGGGIGRNLSNPVLINPNQGGFRLNTESKWYSWSTSFQLGYQFDNLWYTAIGFDLNQTKNRFDYWRRDVSSLLVGENQRLQITKEDFFNIGETNYTFVDLGLTLGKRVNLNKWHFSLEGGVIFNVLFKAKGKVQVDGLEFSRLENQKEYFNKQIGIGARLSAMLDFPLSDQLWISMGPMYQQYFNTLSSYENPLEERNAILLVKARARYHF